MSIEEICRKYKIIDYTINEDGSIDVDGSVDLDYCKLTKLPLKFGIVAGGFYCSNNELTDLKGSPKEVDGDFDCHNNQLTSLSGSPKSIGGGVNCSANELTSLEGSPKSIGGGFYCSNNPIESIFNNVDMDFIRAFNTFKVLKDRVIDLKRLKYVMELFDLPINIGRIKRNFRIK
jgi:hypothetical protein